jgi:transposase InsO family protein
MKRTTKKRFSKVLSEIYYDPGHGGGLSGINALYTAVAKSGQLPGVKRRDVKEWLQEQETYTLHKPVRHRFPRSKVIVAGIDFQWQADLTSLISLSKYNRGYKYLLCVIDVLSKYAWVIPLKNKTGLTLIQAFKTILRQGRQPKRLQTDKGTEFLNRDVQQFLKKRGIHFFTTENSETKASIVERFQRTFKGRMWKYFTRHNTYQYITVLPQLVQGYNKAYHRSIQRAPESVNAKNEESVWTTLYKQKRTSSPKQTAPLRVGDIVRISKSKGTFEKGYLANWTKELFTIFTIIRRRDSIVYTLKDSSGEVLKGTFYNQELQKVTKQGHVYDVETVLRSRRRKVGKRVINEVLVHWKGYPNSHDSWIPKSALLLTPGSKTKKR